MITLDDGELVTAAHQAASAIEGTGKSTNIGVSKVTSIRLLASQLAPLKAVAGKSGKTLNATITMIIEVGLEEVLKKLSPETLQQVKDMSNEHLDELLNDHSNSES